MAQAEAEPGSPGAGAAPEAAAAAIPQDAEDTEDTEDSGSASGSESGADSGDEEMAAMRRKLKSLPSLGRYGEDDGALDANGKGGGGWRSEGGATPGGWQRPPCGHSLSTPPQARGTLPPRPFASGWRLCTTTRGV